MKYVVTCGTTVLFTGSNANEANSFILENGYTVRAQYRHAPFDIEEFKQIVVARLITDPYEVTPRGLILHVESGDIRSCQQYMKQFDAGFTLPKSLVDFLEAHKLEFQYFDSYDEETKTVAEERFALKK